MVDDIEDQGDAGQIEATLRTASEPSVVDLPAVVFRDPNRGEPTESTSRVQVGKHAASKPAKTNYRPFRW